MDQLSSDLRKAQHAVEAILDAPKNVKTNHSPKKQREPHHPPKSQTVNKIRYHHPRKSMSYEQCVIQQVTECIGKRAFYIVPFFCGHDRRCRFPSEWALERAIENVKKHYTAERILEELQDSLLGPVSQSLFSMTMTNISDKSFDNQSEARISVAYNNNCHLSLMTSFVKHPPDMFSGALDTFLRFEHIANRNKMSVGVTQYKKKPSAKTALYVKTVVMKYEYQLYDWIRSNASTNG